MEALKGFSKNEIRVLKILFSESVEDDDEGEEKKSQIYRKVFNSKTKYPTQNFNNIVKKFKALPIETQNYFKRQWCVKMKEDILEKKATSTKQVEAYIKGTEENNRKFGIEFKKGKKIGIKVILSKLEALDLKSREGILEAKEHLFSIFLERFHDLTTGTGILKKEDGTIVVQGGQTLPSIIKALVDLTKIEKEEDDEALLKLAKEAQE